MSLFQIVTVKKSNCWQGAMLKILFGQKRLLKCGVDLKLIIRAAEVVYSKKCSYYDFTLNFHKFLKISDADL